jgi:ribosome maturation factor RimP
MELSNDIQRLIEPVVGDLGFEIVRVQVSGQKKLLVQVMVEHKDGKNITVDDCATVSRAISALLDVEDPIKGAYTIEVSSPGIDRPLVRIGDFERFRGFQAKIETNRPLDGRRRFKGQLLGVDGDTVKILVEGQEMGFSHPDIHRAKLLLTDDLIAAAEGNKGI